MVPGCITEFHGSSLYLAPDGSHGRDDASMFLLLLRSVSPAVTAPSPAPLSSWVSASQSIGEGICNTRGADEVWDTTVASSRAMEAVVSFARRVLRAYPVRDLVDRDARRPSFVATALAYSVPRSRSATSGLSSP